MKKSSTGDGVGGLRADGIQPRISYQKTMHAHHDVDDSLVQRRDRLQESIAAVARHALDTNALLSPKQKEKLRDIERGRYPTTLLDTLVDAMIGARNPLILIEQLQTATLDRMAAPTLCVLDTYLENTRKQKEGDIAQALFIVERTPARRDQLLDALGPEEVTLRQHREAVMRWNPSNRRHFT